MKWLSWDFIYPSFAPLPSGFCSKMGKNEKQTLFIVLTHYTPIAMWLVGDSQLNLWDSEKIVDYSSSGTPLQINSIKN